MIDGSKALRKAIDLMFGDGTPMQSCRNHKLRNVLGHLLEAQHEQARATFKAALKLDAKEGAAKLEPYATWLERERPSGRVRCARGWRSCPRSTGWACPASRDAAWGRRT